MSVVAGNPSAIGQSAYRQQHEQALRTLVLRERPHYIIGTCSDYADLEKAVALEYQTILMAQMGSPGFYKDNPNPYVFGFHVSSDTYARWAVRELKFYADEPQAKGSIEDVTPEKLPIRIIYRNQSEFYRSTCQVAGADAEALGFTVEMIEMDPNGDHNDDGVPNYEDEDYLKAKADLVCPPGTAQEFGFLANPSIFACVDTEQDVLLARWRENGCRPTSIFLTSSTTPWAKEDDDLIQFFLGGAQWHEGFVEYSDWYFSNGAALLSYTEEEFGYRGNYDTVVSYAIPVLFAQHAVSMYRRIDVPNLTQDFSPARMNRIRKDLAAFKEETIFGPFILDENQQNVGRVAAGTQWIPSKELQKQGVLSKKDAKKIKQKNVLVDPIALAQASVIIPSGAALSCSKGTVVDPFLVATDDCFLCSKCAPCPPDTFGPSRTLHSICYDCDEGTSTEGQEGLHVCFKQDQNLIPRPMKVTGYTLFGINWFLALTFMGWTIKYRKDPVVKIGQMGFLLLICFGALLSSSSILLLSYEAGVDDDTSTATAACRALPFVYWIGWVLQYSSLSAKSYRLYRVTHASSTFRRVSVPSSSMYIIVASMVVVDLIGLLLWAFLAPLEVRAHNKLSCGYT